MLPAHLSDFIVYHKWSSWGDMATPRGLRVSLEDFNYLNEKASGWLYLIFIMCVYIFKVSFAQF